MPSWRPEDQQAHWDAILASEGMPAELKTGEIRPRLDRRWYDCFPNKGAAQDEAIQRLLCDAAASAELFSMLADIRWGRATPVTGGALTTEEHEVFDLYADGVPLEDIAAQLEITYYETRTRFFATLSRFTHIKPRLSGGRGHR